MRTSEWILLLIFLSSAILSLFINPYLPDVMASHWGLSGEPDGYSPKILNLILFPSLLLIFFLMFYYIPRIDPLKSNVAKFRKYFDYFIIIISGFFLYLQSLVILFNLGFEFNLGSLIIPGFSILIYYSGVMMSHAKRNWFIGIKTPWTLSSDKVWDKTHELGGRIFKVIGVIMLAGVINPVFGFYLMIIPLLASTIYLFYYSYREYKNEKNHLIK